MAAALGFYFTLGFLFQLPELALLWRARELGFPPSIFGVVGGISSLPWTLKPVWGYVVDSVHRPLWQWCAMCLLTWLGGWYALTTDNITPTVFALSALSGSFSLCFSDVIVDSVTVVHVRDCERPDQSGLFQTRIWQARAVGGLLAAVIGGVGVQTLGSIPVFYACMVLVIPSLAALIWDSEFQGMYRAKQEQRHARENAITSHNNCAHSVTQVCAPTLRGMVLFTFVISAVPSIGAFLAYYIIEHHVSATNMMLIDVVDYAARSIGATLWHRYLRAVPYRKLFSISTLVIVALKACNFMLLASWINEPWHYTLVAAMDGAALCIATQVLVLPIMCYVAKATARGSEGTTYATAISISNLGGLVSAMLGSAIGEAMGVGTDGRYDALGELIAVTTALALAPLVVVRMVPRGITAHTRTAVQSTPTPTPDSGVELQRRSPDMVVTPMPMPVHAEAGANDEDGGDATSNTV